MLRVTPDADFGPMLPHVVGDGRMPLGVHTAPIRQRWWKNDIFTNCLLSPYGAVHHFLSLHTLLSGGYYHGEVLEARGGGIKEEGDLAT